MERRVQLAAEHAAEHAAALLLLLLLLLLDRHGRRWEVVVLAAPGEG